MNRRPSSGEIYRHFKDKLYQIVTIAKHSETGEELVIYQALYGDYKCYARPLEMFVSEVDHEKYPNVKQKYRFERRTNNPPLQMREALSGGVGGFLCQVGIEKPYLTSCEAACVHEEVAKADSECPLYLRTDNLSVADENSSCKEEVACEKQKERMHESNIVGDFNQNSNQKAVLPKTDRIKYLTAEERMMAFFDTDDLEERYKILSSLRDDITDTMIDNMAVVMDIVIEDGNLTKRYDDLKHAIQTKQRYEQNTRLR